MDEGIKRTSQDPDEWWAGVKPSHRTFYRDVMNLVRDLLGEEVLQVSFIGTGFSPRLISKGFKCEPGGRGRGRFRPCLARPEVWWEQLGRGERVFVQRLAALFPRLQRDQDQCLEFRRVPGGFRAEHILKFKKPIRGGRPEVN